MGLSWVLAERSEVAACRPRVYHKGLLSEPSAREPPVAGTPRPRRGGGGGGGSGDIGRPGRRGRVPSRALGRITSVLLADAASGPGGGGRRGSPGRGRRRDPPWTPAGQIAS